MLVAGLGLGLVLVSVSVSVMTGARDDETGMLSGLNTTGHEIGGSIGIAIVATIAAGSAGLNVPGLVAHGIGDAFLALSRSRRAGQSRRPRRDPLRGDLPPQAATRPARRHPLGASCPTTRTTPRTRTSAKVVAGSLLGGVASAIALVAVPFADGGEATITGAILLGFAIGWALLAMLSTRLGDGSHRWAAVPAAVLGLSGAALIILTPEHAGARHARMDLAAAAARRSSSG